jgi:large subunit ribosomal protein L6
MSRVGKQPVRWADGTKVSVAGQTLKVETSKASLVQVVDPAIRMVVEDKERVLRFERVTEGRRERALHGLYRSLAAGMVEGVEKGFVKKLEIQGVGYNGKVEGKTLVLAVGFNKPVRKPIPAGITVEAPTPTFLIIKGASKQLVGQFAAEIRAARKPEPYKGKGIRYDGEIVRRKVGKSLGA